MKFHLQAFFASCLLVAAALAPHAPRRDIAMGFVLAAGVRFAIARRRWRARLPPK